MDKKEALVATCLVIGFYILFFAIILPAQYRQTH
jgi:hypothetical protein